MSSAYDQQIQKLVDHIQTLNQALHERNMQIAHWQQVARAVQDERSRLATGLMSHVQQALAGFSTRFQGLRAENKKLRSYIDHQRQLHESVARDLQGQLRYALARIEELARERGEWRHEMSASHQAAFQYQQQWQEQKAVIASQQAALTELRAQLEAAQGFIEYEEQLRGEVSRLESQLSASQAELERAEAAIERIERTRLEAEERAESARSRADEEIERLRAELAKSRETAESVDDRVDEMTKLLANSEKEVANLFKQLHEERSIRKETEIRFEAASKELTAHKRKVTRLEKERETAKGVKMSDMEKQVKEMNKNNQDLQERIAQLQEELVRALADKTEYMKAVEGQKGKLRSLKPPTEGSS